MNLLVKKFRLLAVVLSSALLAISCEDPGRIGLLINADNGVISTHYQDIVIPTSMVQFDIRKTTNTGILQAGQYNNPDYGRVTTKSYIQIGLPAVDPPAEAAVYASFEMSISFTNLYGATPINNEEQTIDVYQLAQEIDTTYDYNRLDELALNAIPLGSWDVIPMIADTLRTDSVYVISLDDVVGQDLFEKFKAGDPVFADNGAFAAYFKGLAFVPGNNNIDIFQINNTVFKLSINYTELNTDGTEIERSFDQRIRAFGFYHLDADIAGTPFSGISPNNMDYDTPGDDYRYLQYGTMMAIRADISDVYLLMDTLENMIINKAEITLGLDPLRQYGDFLAPPPFLQVYFTKESAPGSGIWEWPIIDDVGRYDTTQVGVNFVMLQDEQISTPPPPPGIYSVPSLAYLDTETNRYGINLSWFLQNQYIGGFQDDTEPYIEEGGQIFIFGESSVILSQRTNTQSMASPMTVHQDSIRLRIHYTIPAQ